MRFFEIKPMDRNEAIRVVGNSLAATSTSTAVAAGLASLLFLKLLRKRDLLSAADTLNFEQLEHLRKIFYDASIDLTTLGHSVFDSNPPKPFRYGKANWTIWDVWRLKSNARVMDLWDTLKSRGVDLRMLASVSLVELLWLLSCE